MPTVSRAWCRAAYSSAPVGTPGSGAGAVGPIRLVNCGPMLLRTCSVTTSGLHGIR
jgi:hypothetical protein